MKKSSACTRQMGGSGASDFTGSVVIWLTVLLAAGVVESGALPALAIVSISIWGAFTLVAAGRLRLIPARVFR